MKQALELRAQGHTGKEIAEITGYNPWYVSKKLYSQAFNAVWPGLFPPFFVKFSCNTPSIPAKICLDRRKNPSPIRHSPPMNTASKLAAKYHAGGLNAITGSHYGGNRRNMTFEEESAFLKQFIDDADGGQITDVSAIKAAYDEKAGHSFSFLAHFPRIRLFSLHENRLL